MSNLDEMLEQIGGAPPPARLAMIDEAVMSALTQQQSSPASNSLRTISIAAIAALALGVVSSGFSGSPASAASPVSPFGMPSSLAPSSLLLASK